MTPRISELVNGPHMLSAYLHMVQEGKLDLVNARYAAAVENSRLMPDFRERAAWGTDDWREFNEGKNEGFLKLATMFERLAEKYRRWAEDPRYKGVLRPFSADESRKLSRGFEQFAQAIRAECR